MSGEPSGDEARAGRTAFARAYDALGHVGGFILAVMTAAVFLQVVLRFLGSASIDGLDEVPNVPLSHREQGGEVMSPKDSPRPRWVLPPVEQWDAQLTLVAPQNHVGRPHARDIRN